MCGIAGSIRWDGQPVQTQALQKMLDRIAHRGPDDQGIYIPDPQPHQGAPSVGLAHCRLAIIDTGQSGHQPMTLPDGSVSVSLNGEIYNYLELRASLEKQGVVFSSNSDTEVILHQYQLEGLDFLNAFRGMFSFSLWDVKKQRLILARDRLGKKPLWYAKKGRGLSFASECQALLSDPELSRDIDPEALDLYLVYGYVPSPKSIFSAVKKVPPAHFLICDQNGLQVKRYWSLSYQPKCFMSEPEVQDRFTDLLRESVKIRMRSDVPLGAFLSGGLDSSAVVAVMSSLSSRPVQTFSIGFEDADYSELEHAQLVADRFGSDHHPFIVKPSAATLLPNLVRHYGEPYADSSCIPTFYLSEQTRRHVKVALCGDGGDELLGGYPRYVGGGLSSQLDRLPHFLKTWSGLLGNCLGGTAAVGSTSSTRSRAGRFLQAVSEHATLEERYLRWMAHFMPEQLDGLYTASYQPERNGSRPSLFLAELIRTAPAEAVEERLMAADLHSYLPEDLLVKVDIASMAQALEVRSPLLDHQLMEFVAQLPLKYKIHCGKTKRLLRSVMKPVLPPQILQRSKMGFGIPLGRWLQKDLRSWMEEILLDRRVSQRGIFNPQQISKLVLEHTSGRQDHRFKLWSLLVFELWHSEVLDAA